MYVYANGAFKGLSTDVSKFSATNASVADGSYLEVAHNQNTNDINATGWVYNTTTSQWEQTDNLGVGSTASVDMMEYSSDALAQAAYVGDAITYGTTDRLTGGTATADDEVYGPPTTAVDNNESTAWTNSVGGNDWWKYDSGVGVTWAWGKFRCKPNNSPTAYGPNGFRIYGSNDDSSYTLLYDGNMANNSDWQEWTWVNSTKYRYIKFNPYSGYGGVYSLWEIEAMEAEFPLQDYSESTIKQQGSYSLKGVGVGTTAALNKSLTRTVSPVIDLTDQKTIKFDVRSSRTGTNLQAQIHDSGGTTSTHDINIASADTWQTETWDISGVSNGDKNAIDQIVFKVTNADVENIFYIDNMISSSGDYLIVQPDANTARLYNYSGSAQNLRLDVIAFGADLAEWYATDDLSIEPGDVVCFSGEKDRFSVPKIAKSSKPGDSRLLGIISTRAGKELGLPGSNRRLIALAGRVRIKIDPESEPIEVGDFLTSSDKSGLASKATKLSYTVAKALESWSLESGKDRIQAFIHLGVYLGE